MPFSRPALLLLSPNASTPESPAAPWRELKATLQRIADLHFAEAADGALDAASLGATLDEVVALSRRAVADAGPRDALARLMSESGQRAEEIDEPAFAGSRDVAFDRERHVLWGGFGFGTDRAALNAVGDALAVEVAALTLVDKRFPTLDSCLLPLDGGALLYYPAAFDAPSRALVARLVPPDKRFAVGEADAAAMACGALALGRDIVAGKLTPELETRLIDLGYRVHRAPAALPGCVRSYVLRLDVPRHAPATADDPLAYRVMPGPDALLSPVEQDGVAPDDFLITTIYPTEIRVGGQWIRVRRQRMDAMVVVSDGPDGAPVAECRLLRDLKQGERVVCGSDGVRTIAKASKARAEGEFQFMGSGVSSERRVEVALDQIAWEMRRLRDRGGRAVVVAGPVVVHTGGAPALADLVREGYVSALLGGNAIAVHDLERAIYGTSLGVDLARDAVVRGGHKHHIKTINLIRRMGGIRQAVEAGLIPSGIMRECVLANVPFSLAGSIRDDGPLPETKMDLVEAQREYSELIQGADMILMLSSMLHSIGVGNMTPAGVKLICVDINPAVVTKLADRGSAESVGVVTDVGLFLRLLVDKLREYDAS